MSQFFQELFESIFTPGPTPSLLVATNVTFACLQLVLGALLVATYSIHFIILSFLCGGLWWAINWFAAELKANHEQELKEQARVARQKSAAAGPLAASESETEVESVGGRGPRERRRKKKAEAEAEAAAVEVEEPAPGELKHRATGASQGTKSSVSTEDEWEKVSESENDPKNK